MPDGWKFGDDVFARLKAGNIEFARHREKGPKSTQRKP
jgi:hypothetical protein